MGKSSRKDTVKGRGKKKEKEGGIKEGKKKNKNWGLLTLVIRNQWGL